MLKQEAALVEAAVAEAEATGVAMEAAALPDITDFSDFQGEQRRQRPSRLGREAKLARRKARCVPGTGFLCPCRHALVP